MAGWSSQVAQSPGLALAQSPSPEASRPAAEAVEAVVLAGGHCWGEDPLEQVVCRPLVPIAGRPLLVHTIEWLRRGGITRANICVNQEARQIRRLLGDGSRLGVELNYFEDVMPRGPAGCASDVAGQTDAGRLLVLEGTILPRLDLRDLLDRAPRSTLTVVAIPLRSGSSSGERQLGPAGIYIFSQQAFTHVPQTGYQDIKETLIPRLHVNGERVDTLVVDARSVSSVSGLGSYLAVSHQVLEQMTQQTVPEGYLRVDGALIHLSARIDGSVRLVGPVLIGPQVEMGPGCIVVGPTTVGARTRIGGGSAISRSVLWSDCVVEEGATLDQCIVTNHSVVRSGRELRHSVVVPRRRDERKTQDALVSDALSPDGWWMEPDLRPDAVSPAVREPQGSAPERPAGSNGAAAAAAARTTHVQA